MEGMEEFWNKYDKEVGPKDVDPLEYSGLPSGIKLRLKDIENLEREIELKKKDFEKKILEDPNNSSLKKQKQRVIDDKIKKLSSWRKQIESMVNNAELSPKYIKYQNMKKLILDKTQLN